MLGSQMGWLAMWVEWTKMNRGDPIVPFRVTLKTVVKLQRGRALGYAPGHLFCWEREATQDSNTYSLMGSGKWLG